MLVPTLVLSLAAVAAHAALLFFPRPASWKAQRAKVAKVKQTQEEQADRLFQSMRWRGALGMLAVTWTSVFVLSVGVGVAQSMYQGKVLLLHDKDENKASTVPLGSMMISAFGMTVGYIMESRCVKAWRKRSSFRKDKHMIGMMLSCLLAGFAIHGVYNVQTAGSGSFGAYRDSVNAVRMVLCMVWMQPLPTFLWTIFNMSTYILALVAADQGNVSTVVLAEASIGVLTCVTTVFSQNIVKSLARSEVEARTSQKEVVAVKSLLSTMCDVVVQLDGDLKMVGPHAALAAFLFCQDNSTISVNTQGSDNSGGSTAGQQLSGALFQPYLATEEDQQVFRERMEVKREESASEQGERMADAFQASLRDKLGNEIRVQIYHMPFEVAEGAIHHIIGFSESVDYNGFSEKPEKPPTQIAPLAKPSVRRLPAFPTASTASSESRAFQAFVPAGRVSSDRGAGDQDGGAGGQDLRRQVSPAEAEDEKAYQQSVADLVETFQQQATMRQWAQARIAKKSRRRFKPRGLSDGPLASFRGTPPRVPPLTQHASLAPATERTVTPATLGRQDSVRSAAASVGSRSSRSSVESDSVLSFDESAMERFESLKESYVHPHLQPTMPIAKELSIMGAMMKWNFYTGGSCCAFHAGINIAMAATKKMNKADCLQINWGQARDAPQCEKCGLVATAGELNADRMVCAFCDHLDAAGAGAPGRRERALGRPLPPVVQLQPCLHIAGLSSVLTSPLTPPAQRWS